MFSGLIKVNLLKEMTCCNIFHAGYFIRYVLNKFMGELKMKTFNFNYVFFIIVLVFLNSCDSPTEGESYGHVFGTVTSISGNSPIAGVIVQCNGKTYTTGSDGYYIIEDIPVGNNQLTATKTDFETYSKTVNVKLGGTEENISMVSNIVGASVWGYVKHTDGTPISRASVTIAGMTDNTDATGRYQLPSIPQGNQNIQVQADGYETYNQSFYMYSSDKQIDINLRKYYEQDFYLDKDTWVSNWGSTTSGDEATLFATYCQNKRYTLYLHAPVSIPSGSYVTDLEAVFDITQWYYEWNWMISTISENWSEYNMSNANEPNHSSNYSAPFVKKEGDKVYIDIKNAYDYNSNNFLQYGFRMLPEYDSDSPDWSGFWIPSRENSQSSKRPYVKVLYLY